MRIFVAIFPPAELREAVLARAREAIGQQDNDRIRWSTPQNVHLTLKFLGDVKKEALENVSAALGQVCAGHTSFHAGLRGFGAFPSLRRARILWAGVGAGSEELRSLAADVDTVMNLLGFTREERPYVPHYTLGRMRDRPASIEISSPETWELGFHVQRVELVESTLTTEGAIYKTIQTFALKKD